MSEKLYDINIEATILSSLIFERKVLEKNITKLKLKYFFKDVHKKILNIIIDRFNNNKIINEEILINQIEQKYENDLLIIVSKTPIYKIDDYIDILQDYSIKRDMQSLAFDIRNSLENNITGIEIQSNVSNLTETLISSNSVDLLEINNINNIKDKEVEYICKSWLPIPRRTVSLITAPGGIGKSWLVQQLAIRSIEEGIVQKAFLWLSEDPKEISKSRFTKIYKDILNLNDESIISKIDISDSSTIQFLYDDYKKVEISPLFIHFKVMLQKYDLIILDPLIGFYGTDENNNSSARKFMQLFTEWANKEDKTIIFIHHSSKNTTQSRGASAFVDAVRTVYEIDLIKDDDTKEKNKTKRVIKLTKDNYAIGTILKSKTFERVLFPKEKKKNYKDEVEKLNGLPSNF